MRIGIGARVRLTTTAHPKRAPKGALGTIINVDGGYILVLLDGKGLKASRTFELYPNEFVVIEGTKRIPQKKVSRKKIVWDDIEFTLQGVLGDGGYAAHKESRCGEPSIGRNLRRSIARFRVFVNKRKVLDHTVCEACRVPVGKSAQQRLEAGKKAVSNIGFGPLAKNLCTSYYNKVLEDAEAALRDRERADEPSKTEVVEYCPGCRKPYPECQKMRL